MSNIAMSSMRFLFIFFVTISQAEAGGVSLGATRVIYPSTKNEISLSVYNADDTKDYLIQSWVEEDEHKTDKFIITPPLFVIKPKKENLLRISNVGSGYPNDRESIFWLSVKAIPSSDKNENNQNMLKLAIVSKIKLFYRPDNLKIKTNEIVSLLMVKTLHNKIVIKNPTPYYVTLVNIVSGTEKINSLMIDPFSDKEEKFPGAQPGKLTYKIINDYGAAVDMQ